MRSKFAIAGHPIHPALVALPIGLFAWAVVCDFVYLFSDSNELWYDMAFWSSIAAIVTALIAALPGFGDYLAVVNGTPASNIGLVHMVLNVATIILFAVAAVIMYDDGARDGAALTLVIALHLIGIGLLSLSGWLGGEMVFRHGVGVLSEDERRAEGPLPRPQMRPARSKR
jgi:uncharacterized membrane protein